jgi:hypothetical protein
VGTPANGLPDLPPEWGKIHIPDDAAELDAEAELVRKDLRREVRQARRKAWRARWRRRFGMPPRIDNPEEPSLWLPMLVLGIALLITMLSLLLIAWPSLTRSTPPQHPEPSQHSESSPAVVHSS